MDIKSAKENAFSALVSVIFYSSMITSHMLAISLAKVANVISIKRISLIIGVYYDYIFIRGNNVRDRLSSLIMMLIGFLLIFKDG